LQCLEFFSMNSIRLAVIILAPLSSGYTILFDRDIAGLSLFKRLLLTLQQAGIKEFVVLTKHLPENKLAEIENDLKKDSRFNGQLIWADQKQYLKKKNENLRQVLDNPLGFLLLDGNLLISAKLVDDFLWKAWWMDIGLKQHIAQLKFPQNDAARIFLLPSHSAKRLDGFLINDSIDGVIEPVTLERESFLLETIEDGPSARRAERAVIQKHKYYYSQLMDKWVHSRFSLLISSRLVKTFLTPSQITLLSLLIGFCAGWFLLPGQLYWRIVWRHPSGWNRHLGLLRWRCGRAEIYGI
jgi:hypothetical protein